MKSRGIKWDYFTWGKSARYGEKSDHNCHHLDQAVDHHFEKREGTKRRILRFSKKNNNKRSKVTRSSMWDKVGWESNKQKKASMFLAWL